jgi:2-iminobutanoate/2-iminopropanoate deaminase
MLKVTSRSSDCNEDCRTWLQRYAYRSEGKSLPRGKVEPPKGPEIIMNEFANLLGKIARSPIKKRAITNHEALNEAYLYAKPSSFSRGMRVDLNGLAVLFISGTGSIDENGSTVHVGNFRDQLKRTLKNITALLASEGATWHDIVRTTCYFRDFDRDYEAFNEERTACFEVLGIDPLPASTAIEVKLCRPDLLIEIEAIAMFRTQPITGENG